MPIWTTTPGTGTAETIFAGNSGSSGYITPVPPRESNGGGDLRAYVMPNISFAPADNYDVSTTVSPFVHTNEIWSPGGTVTLPSTLNLSEGRINTLQNWLANFGFRFHELANEVRFLGIDLHYPPFYLWGQYAAIILWHSGRNEYFVVNRGEVASAHANFQQIIEHVYSVTTR